MRKSSARPRQFLNCRGAAFFIFSLLFFVSACRTYSPLEHRLVIRPLENYEEDDSTPESLSSYYQRLSSEASLMNPAYDWIRHGLLSYINNDNSLLRNALQEISDGIDSKNYRTGFLDGYAFTIANGAKPIVHIMASGEESQDGEEYLNGWIKGCGQACHDMEVLVKQDEAPERCSRDDE